MPSVVIKKGSSSGQTRYEFYLGRHGQSQANLLKQPWKSWPKSLRHVPGDPSLTLTGVIQTQQTANILKKKKFEPDFVFCSNLFRAMQTALLTFPKKKVYVVPYLKEETNLIDRLCWSNAYCYASENKPFTTITRQLQMRCQNPDDIKRLRFSQKLLEKTCHYIEDSRTENGNIQKCIEEIILPMIKKKKKTGVIKIAIISHSGIIKSFLNKYSKNLTDKYIVEIPGHPKKRVEPTNNLIVQYNPKGNTETQLTRIFGSDAIKPESKILFQGWHNREEVMELDSCDWLTKNMQKQESGFFSITEIRPEKSIKHHHL